MTCSKSPPAFLACALLFLLSFAATLSWKAQAQLPLTQILESAAGRYLLEEMPEGVELISRLVGRELRAADRQQALTIRLRNPELRRLENRLVDELNELRESLRAEGHLAGEVDVFASAARNLTEVERRVIRQRFIERTNREDFLRLMPPGQASPLGGAAEFVEARAVNALESFDQLRKAAPELSRLLRRSNVEQIVKDAEVPLYSQRLQEILGAVAKNASELPVEGKFKNAARQMLEGKVPASTIEARLSGLRKRGLLSLKRALGDLSLEETQIMLHGGNPLAPTPESWLGKYLQESGAATVVRSFPSVPVPQGTDPAVLPQGPKRLVVAVSQDSWRSFEKYFANEQLLGHVHTTNQGTLMVSFNKKVSWYTQFGNNLRTPTYGSIMPQILLKTTEGQRASNFFKLGEQDFMLARHPWQLDGYCARGAYESCTQWFGNIPIGDKKVAEYKFPGAIDNHANNLNPLTDPGPRVKPLKPYPEHHNPLVKHVWRVPGNEQLADVLGLQAQNLAGEFANPGYVAVTLTGLAPVERVPVVFYVVPDHRAALAADFPLSIAAY